MFIGITFVFAAVMVVWFDVPVAADHAHDHHGHRDGHQISRQEYDELRRNFSFMNYFDKTVLEVCYGEFFHHCLPLLRGHEAAYDIEFRPTRAQCDEEFCNCSGIAATHCAATIDHTSSCEVVDRCWPNFKKCIGRWIYTPLRLPGSCRDFMHCTRSPQGIRAEDKLCAAEMVHHPKCDAAQGCSYVVNPAGPPVPPPTQAPEPHKVIGHGTRIAVSVFIACIATGGFVVMLIAAVAMWSRLRRRRNVVPGLAPAVHIEVADPVGGLAWANWSAQHKARPVRSRIATQHLQTPNSRRGCWYFLADASGVAAVSVCRVIQQSPGCQAASPPTCGFDATPAMSSQREKESARPRIAAAAAETPIEAIVDLSAVYVDERDASESVPMIGGGAPSCCICLSEPVRVVALPCGHLSTCSSCAHRLCKPVPRRGAATSTVEVASQCPQCRTTTNAMVVLDDNQLTAAVTASRMRERDALN
eukprot:CAMPEP_0174828612 /NCGR_PEP_ID=MMETSP1114-20130205/1429_1 /TAXON_ID=312471 /ORGANISM="Neobodo designis, Strain CCAP 1951/1" /LENGTH=473 /DNA_ID=CAMNT_0016062333 /DNA_START=29 /DNA_END=1450 /DNA_ORIENTATION=+